jgi:hypothetical protein
MIWGAAVDMSNIYSKQTHVGDIVVMHCYGFFKAGGGGDV